MRTITVVVVVLALTMVFSGCPRQSTTGTTTTPPAGGAAPDQPTPPAEPEWVEFVSEEHGFSVLMPKAPQEETQPAQDTPLGKFEFVLYTATDGAVPYVAQVITLPEGAGSKVDGSKFLANQVQSITDRFPGATITKQEDLTLDGHPGKAIELDVPKGEKYPGGITYCSRIYFMGDQAFQLIVTVIEQYKDDAQADKFFDSFRLIEPAAEGA